MAKSVGQTLRTICGISQAPVPARPPRGSRTARSRFPYSITMSVSLFLPPPHTSPNTATSTSFSSLQTMPSPSSYSKARVRLRSVVDRSQWPDLFALLIPPPNGKSINTYLPMELLREIFLYSIESNQVKSGQLASVCRYWRSVIVTISHLWSTLRVGMWTEASQVTTWLQRAYPKKVIIDTQGDGQPSSSTPAICCNSECSFEHLSLE